MAYICDLVELYNEARKHYSDPRNNKDNIPFCDVENLSDDFLAWLDYFLRVDCTENCLEALKLHLPYGEERRTKSEVSYMLDVSKGLINKRLIEAYRIVRFCSLYLQGKEFISFEDRVSNKIYDKIFMRELLVDVESRTARGCYINGLAKAGVVTLADLLNKGTDYLLRANRLSEKLLCILSDKLESIGISDFHYSMEE